jgi:hypothetical protein
MKQRLIIYSLLSCLSLQAQESTSHYGIAAQEHHDWEDNHVLQINREPARAYYIPFGEKGGRPHAVAQWGVAFPLDKKTRGEGDGLLPHGL